MGHSILTAAALILMFAIMGCTAPPPPVPDPGAGGRTASPTAAPGAATGGLSKAALIAKYEELYAVATARVGDTSDSARVSWIHSYLLGSLLNMYQGTRDEKYLQRFTELVGRIYPNNQYRPLSTTAYTVLDNVANGDFERLDFTRYADLGAIRNGGFEQVDARNGLPVGWERWGEKSTEIEVDDQDPVPAAQADYKVSQGGLRNPDFELADEADPSLPRFWQREQAAPETIALAGMTPGGERPSASPGRLSRIVRIAPAPGRAQPALVQQLSYIPGESYGLAFRARAASGAGSLQIRDSAAGRTLASATVEASEWRRYSLAFRAPAEPDRAVWVRLSAAETGDKAEAEFDDLRLFVPGDRYLKVATNPALGWQVLRQRIRYAPGTAYGVTLWARTTAPEAGGLVQVYDMTARAALAAARVKSTTWGPVGLQFLAPAAAGHEVIIRLSHSQPDVRAEDFFDEVALVDPREYPYPGYYRIPGWQHNDAPEAVHLRSAAPGERGKDGGDYYLEMAVTRESTGMPQADQRLVCEPGARYQVKLAGRATGGIGGRVDVAVQSPDGPRTLADQRVVGARWTTYAFDFIAPKELGAELWLRLRGAAVGTDSVAPGAAVSFDDVSVKQYHRFLVHDGQLAAQLMQFASLVKSDSKRSETYKDLAARYGDIADAYVAIVKDHILPSWEPYWVNINATSGTYVWPRDTSNEFNGMSLPYNQSLSLGRAFVLLAQTQGDERARERATRLASLLRGAMRDENGLYLWHYADNLLPGDARPVQSEDLNHGNLGVHFAYLAYQAGIVFTRADMERIAATFLRRAFNGSRDDPRLSELIDGSKAYETPEVKSFGWWADYADFDPEVLQVAERLLAANWDKLTSPRFSYPFAALEISAVVKRT